MHLEKASTCPVSLCLQHWPAVVFNNYQDFLEILSSEERDAYEDDEDDGGGPKLVGRFLSTNERFGNFVTINSSRPEDTLQDVLNDDTNDLVPFAHIDDWFFQQKN